MGIISFLLSETILELHWSPVMTVIEKHKKYGDYFWWKKQKVRDLIQRILESTKFGNFFCKGCRMVPKLKILA